MANDRIALINLLYELMFQFNIQIHWKSFDYKMNSKSFGKMECDVNSFVTFIHAGKHTHEHNDIQI